MGQVRGLFGTANNVYLFLIEEIDSAAALNTSVTSLASVFQIFSTTIDTAAWLVLLIFFELETYLLSDQTLRCNWPCYPGDARYLPSNYLHCLLGLLRGVFWITRE